MQLIKNLKQQAELIKLTFTFRTKSTEVPPFSNKEGGGKKIVCFL